MLLRPGVGSRRRFRYVWHIPHRATTECGHKRIERRLPAWWHVHCFPGRIAPFQIRGSVRSEAWPSRLGSVVMAAVNFEIVQEPTSVRSSRLARSGWTWVHATGLLTGCKEGLKKFSGTVRVRPQHSNLTFCLALARAWTYWFEVHACNQVHQQAKLNLPSWLLRRDSDCRVWHI